MKLLKKDPILSLANEMAIDSPQPSNINYLYNFGSLLVLVLVIQILTGVFLAMHYTPHIDYAFNSVEHIMRDVNYGWLVRYSHSNGASFFFICVYIHIARGLYYGSYTKPRVGLWTVGVIIYLLMTAIGFLGLIGPKWFDLGGVIPLEPAIINLEGVGGLTLISPLTPPSKFNQRLDKLKLVNVEPLAIILYPTKYTWQTSQVTSLKNYGGYYWWYNISTDQDYIGSGFNIFKRLTDYWASSKLAGHLPIYRSITKYGHSQFILVILEIAGPTKECKLNNQKFLERESYYIELFKTFGNCINILDRAESSLGYKHSDVTKEHLSKIYTDERREMVRNLNKGGLSSLHKENISTGKKAFWENDQRANELRAKYSEEYGKAIGLFEIDGSLYATYSSILKAANELNCDRKTIRKALTTGTLFKNRWYIRLTPTWGAGKN